MSARPIYETPADQSREEQVRVWLERHCRCTAVKLKPLYQFDHALVQDGEIQGFAEIKCRTFPSTQYRSYLISGDKMVKALAWRELAGVPCYLVVAWTDAIGMFLIEPGQDYTVKLGGRKDRKDPQDLEPCFYIPLGWFKIYRT
jgi:hypothetical protein